MKQTRPIPVFFLILLLFILPVNLLATDGHFLHGAGPVNEAMGGADTGICLDATGSIAWNPACTVKFSGRRIELHATIFTPWRSLSSTVDANAFGPGMPGMTLSGTTVSHRDMSLMPGFAFVYHRLGSPTAYHAAMLAVSGFGVDYKRKHRLLQSYPHSTGSQWLWVRTHPVQLHACHRSRGLFSGID